MSNSFSRLLCLLFIAFFLTACNDEHGLTAGSSASDLSPGSPGGAPGSSSPGGSTSGDSSAKTESAPVPHRSHSNAEQARSAPQLSWQPPFSRANGESLAMGEIGGYRLYYRAEGDSTPRVIEISSASKTKLVLDDFGPGSYRFFITTRDVEGLESAPSEEVIVSVL